MYSVKANTILWNGMRNSDGAMPKKNNVSTKPHFAIRSRMCGGKDWKICGGASVKGLRSNNTARALGASLNLTSSLSSSVSRSRRSSSTADDRTDHQAALQRKLDVGELRPPPGESLPPRQADVPRVSCRPNVWSCHRRDSSVYLCMCVYMCMRVYIYK